MFGLTLILAFGVIVYVLVARIQSEPPVSTGFEPKVVAFSSEVISVNNNSRDPDVYWIAAIFLYPIFPYFPDTQAFWFLCCTRSQPPSETCPS